MKRLILLLVFLSTACYASELGLKNFSREYIIDQKITLELEDIGTTKLKVFSYKNSLEIDNVVIELKSAKVGEQFLEVTSFGKLLKVNGVRFDDLNGDNKKDLIIMSVFMVENEQNIIRPFFTFDAYVQTPQGFQSMDLHSTELLASLNDARSIEEAIQRIQAHNNKSKILKN